MIDILIPENTKKRNVMLKRRKLPDVLFYPGVKKIVTKGVHHANLRLRM